MRHKILISLVFIFIFFPFVYGYGAGIPHLIGYQGMLTDDQGNPVNQPRDLTFGIYSVADGGVALWTETHYAVSVEDGLFYVTLGSITPIPSSVFDDTLRFLEITVGADQILSPRTRLTSVGYAYRAERADTADYAAAASPGGSAGGDLSGTYPNPGIANDVVTSAKIFNNTILFEDIAQNGAAAGQVMKWSGSAWAASDDSIGAEGDITAVNPGTGLTGGGESGDVTLNVDFAGTGAAATVSRSDHDHDTDYVNEGQANSVTSSMITDGQIGSGDLGNNAVTTAKILDGTIANVDISNTANIAPSKISGTAWTSNNDGTGSGLDADLLDGQHASAFLSAAADYGRSGVAADLYEGTSTLTSRYVNEGQANSVTSGMITDGEVASGDLANSAVTSDKIQDATIALADLGQNGAAPGQVMKWNGSTWATSNDETGAAVGWDDDGTIVRLKTTTDSVGIGTASPAEKLDVSGNIRASGTITSGSSITLDGTNDKITATSGTIDFDNENIVTAGKAAIGPNNSNTGTNAFVAGDSNSVAGNNSSVGGGRKNLAQGDYSVIPGGYADTITAAGDYSCLFGIGSKLTADSTFMVDMPHVRFGNLSSGYEFPILDGSVGQVMATNGSGQLSWTSISGLGENWSVVDSVVYTNKFWGIARGNAGNLLYGNKKYTMTNLGVECTTGTNGQNYDYCTVVGGFRNVASNQRTTVCGGYQNKATGFLSTVCGGFQNIANGWATTVGGGYADTAEGDYSFVGGFGVRITSDADYTFAFGRSFTTSTPNAVIFHNTSNEIKVGLGITNPTNILTVKQGSASDPIADSWQTYLPTGLSENMNTIDNALDKVLALRGVHFDWKHDKKHDMGLLAEEVSRIIPEVVAYDEEGVAPVGIDYARITPLLVEAIKEQQKQIEALKQEIDALKR